MAACVELLEREVHSVEIHNRLLYPRVNPDIGRVRNAPMICYWAESTFGRHFTVTFEEKSWHKT
jgi:hypothetical protein